MLYWRRRCLLQIFTMATYTRTSTQSSTVKIMTLTNILKWKGFQQRPKVEWCKWVFYSVKLNCDSSVLMSRKKQRKHTQTLFHICSVSKKMSMTLYTCLLIPYIIMHGGAPLMSSSTSKSWKNHHRIITVLVWLIPHQNKQIYLSLKKTSVKVKLYLTNFLRRNIEI